MGEMAALVMEGMGEMAALVMEEMGVTGVVKYLRMNKP